MTVAIRGRGGLVRPIRPDDASSWFLVRPVGLAVDAAVHRAALAVLRDDLATIWVDVVAARRWPAEVVAEVAVAESRVRESRRRPGRPGRSPETVALDAAAADDFAVATALAPESRAVEAMSRRGRVVCARLGPDEPLRLRLTRDQFAGIVAEVPAAGRHVVPASRAAGPARAVRRGLARGWRRVTAARKPPPS